MAGASGTLSMESTNVFSILRSWLYTEQDIVLRELVANAADAVAKRRDLVSRGMADCTTGRIDVVVDAGAATLSVTDDGVGMSADEVDKNLNQIAYSGAAELVASCEQEDAPSVIGHFGVGFYSAFMLADRASVDTLSCLEGAEPVHWECTDRMDWTLAWGDRALAGTSVVLHLPDDSPYLAGPDAALAALRKHVAFLGIPVSLTFREADGSVREGCDALAVSDPDPVWRRAVRGEVDPGEMKAFYRAYFDDPCDPLMWIPLASLDIGLRGVIFVRDTRGGASELDGHVDVYSRGVFVGRDVGGLIPTFVGLQSGIVECDDLPLVVSRGGVREGTPDGGVPALVAEALTQEITIRMHRLMTEERADYERLWPEIGSFVKYGCLTDRTFASVMIRRVLFEDLDGGFHTLDEFRGSPPASTVLYASDRAEQSLVIDVFRRAGIPALLLDHVIDQPLVRALEASRPGLAFSRLDSDPVSLLVTDELAVSGPVVDAVTDEFTARVDERLPACRTLAVNLRTPDVPILLTQDEASRRIGDMAELYGLVGAEWTSTCGQVDRTVVLNTAAPVVTALRACPDAATRAFVIDHLIDVTLLAGSEADPAVLPAHLRRTVVLLEHYLTSNRPSAGP